MAATVRLILVSLNGNETLAIIAQIGEYWRSI